MKAYAVQATVNGRQVPTFYLLANVQGIVNAEHAAAIAREIIGATLPDGTTDPLDVVHVHAEPVTL